AAGKKQEKLDQLRALENHRCDRCNQVWVGEDATRQAAELRAAIPQLDEALRRAADAKALAAQLHQQARDKDALAHTVEDPSIAELEAAASAPEPESVGKLQSAIAQLEQAVAAHQRDKARHDAD